jgi:hypothetical protein
MKTLADFKRALTVGSKWHTFNHLYQADMGIREVSKTQSNCVYFKTTRPDGSICDSRIDFPSADNVEFADDDKVNIYTFNPHDGRRLILTYTRL